MGGYDNTLADQDTIFYAKLNSDGSTGTWSTNANALPAADHSQTSIIANGYVYLIGGNNAGDAVYYASTQRILVGGSLDLIGLGGQGLGDTSGAGTGGSLTAANGSFTGSLQVQGAVSLADALSVDKELRVGGSALFQNQADSTTAFQVQSSAGTNLLAVDTSGSVVYIGVTGSTNVNSTIHIGDSTSGIQTITIGSTNSSSAVTIQAGSGDITLKGHVQSTQTTKPTIGTPSNCGTGSPSAAVTNSSTDSAGSFTITAGTGSPTTCDTIITFNATYGTAPKSIILTATKAVGSATAVLSAQVNASAAGTFTVQIAPTNAAASGVYSFYYWVIK